MNGELKNDDADIIRATFTMPKSDLDSIEELRRRLVKESGEIFNRSEVIRAGLLALQGLPESRLRGVTKQLERFRPGRSKKSNSD